MILPDPLILCPVSCVINAIYSWQLARSAPRTIVNNTYVCVTTIANMKEVVVGVDWLEEWVGQRRSIRWSETFYPPALPEWLSPIFYGLSLCASIRGCVCVYESGHSCVCVCEISWCVFGIFWCVCTYIGGNIGLW